MPEGLYKTSKNMKLGVEVHMHVWFFLSALQRHGVVAEAARGRLTKAYVAEG